jgi:hypothetical protein
MHEMNRTVEIDSVECKNAHSKNKLSKTGNSPTVSAGIPTTPSAPHSFLQKHTAQVCDLFGYFPQMTDRNGDVFGNFYSILTQLFREQFMMLAAD